MKLKKTTKFKDTIWEVLVIVIRKLCAECNTYCASATSIHEQQSHLKYHLVAPSLIQPLNYPSEVSLIPRWFYYVVSHEHTLSEVDLSNIPTVVYIKCLEVPKIYLFLFKVHVL